MFHLLLREEFQTALASSKLDECEIRIHRSLAAFTEASRQADGYAQEIEGIKLYLEEEADNGRIGQDELAQWDRRMQDRWGDTFNRAQRQGKACRLRLESMNVTLTGLWGGQGAQNLPMSLITRHQRFSLNLMETLVRLAKRSTFDDASARLEAKVTARRLGATSSQEYLCTKDVRAVLTDLDQQNQNEQGTADSRTVLLPEEGPDLGLRDIVTVGKKRKAIDGSYHGQSKKSRTGQPGTLDVVAGTPTQETLLTSKPGSKHEEEDELSNGRTPFLEDGTTPALDDGTTPSPEVEVGRNRQKSLDSYRPSPLGLPSQASNSPSLRDLEHSPSRSQSFDPPATATVRADELLPIPDDETEDTRRLQLDSHALTSPSSSSPYSSDSTISTPCPKHGCRPPDKSASKPGVLVSASSHDMRVPGNDIAGALESLRPGQWLSNTAIDLVLRCCGFDRCRVLDTAFISLHRPERLLEKPFLRLVDCTKLIIPLGHTDHWTVVIVDLVTGTVDWSDSSKDARATWRKEAENALTVLVAFLERQDDKYKQLSWQYHYHDSDTPRQANYFDCGIHILVWVIAQFTKFPIPDTLDTGFWRGVFGRLISSNSTPPPSRVIATPRTNPSSGEDGLSHSSPVPTIQNESPLQLLRNRLEDEIKRQQNSQLRIYTEVLGYQRRLLDATAAVDSVKQGCALLEDMLALKKQQITEYVDQQSRTQTEISSLEGLRQRHDISTNWIRILEEIEVGLTETKARQRLQQGQTARAKAIAESWEDVSVWWRAEFLRFVDIRDKAQEVLEESVEQFRLFQERQKALVEEGDRLLTSFQGTY